MVRRKMSFERLLAEGEAEPTTGWDFSWFVGRATEERPSWGYQRLIRARISSSDAVLDAQTGGGEVLAGAVDVAPKRLAVTESWLPNVEVARNNLEHLHAAVIAASDSTLPFANSSFDLVVSRHPVITPWDEVARVLCPGGSFVSQQVGAASNWELIEFMMGPQPIGDARRPKVHLAAATTARLEVADLREERLEIRFFDVGAVVYFLRKVLWTVPGFTVQSYRPQLLAMHETIEREGSFLSHSERFLIEAKKPIRNE